MEYLVTKSESGREISSEIINAVSAADACEWYTLGLTEQERRRFTVTAMEIESDVDDID